jgi:prepilin-type N-terminal cleavage/methylation domain-containing protein
MISLKKRNQGFTIVELLIVIVVIGILALLVITTYSGIQQKARNSKRSSDVKSIQTQLEAFYSQNGYYPSRTDMNSDSWLTTNMKSLDKNALVDPSNPTQSNDMVAAAVAKTYSYAVLNSSDTSCEADDTTCAKYTLTATYEGTVNGQSSAVAKNLDGS